MNNKVIKLSLLLFGLILFFTALAGSVGATDESGNSGGGTAIAGTDNQTSPCDLIFKDGDDQKDEDEDEMEGDDDGESEDEMDMDMDDEAMMEDEADESDMAMEDVEEEQMVVTYLDDLIDHEGWIAFSFKLLESGEDSIFYRRYLDNFPGDPAYLDDLFMRGWNSQGSRYRFTIQDSWGDSYQASLTWNQPGRYNMFLRYSTYDNSQIPSTFPATRRDFDSSITAHDNGDTYGVNFTHRESDVENITVGATNWESDGVGANIALNWCDWHGRFDFNYANYSNAFNRMDYVEHTSGSLRLGRDFGPNNYIEGNVMYSFSEPKAGEELESYSLGGYARFMDTAGPNRFLLTSHINWTFTDEGPSKLHPAGDEFNFDVNGRWRPARNFSLKGSWEHQTSDFTHADQYTLFGFRLNPDWSHIPGGIYYQDTITTNSWNVGADWDITENLSFAADFNWKDRNGLPNTDVVFVTAPTLWWESENHFVYTLRYNGGTVPGFQNGTWLLKYSTQDRDNDDRGSSTSVEQFAVNYTGMVSEDLWLYAGGGFFNMKNSMTAGTSTSQNGPDYGGGLTWYLGEKLTFFGDLWIYDVGGDYGYDETSLSTGFQYDVSDDWNWALEYERVEGNFVSMTDLDYVVENLKLSVKYLW